MFFFFVAWNADGEVSASIRDSFRFVVVPSFRAELNFSFQLLSAVAY